jgi:hypothetical protein
MKRTILGLITGLTVLAGCSDRNNESDANGRKDSVNVSDTRRNAEGGTTNYIHDTVAKEGPLPKEGDAAQPPGGKRN